MLSILAMNESLVGRAGRNSTNPLGDRQKVEGALKVVKTNKLRTPLYTQTDRQKNLCPPPTAEHAKGTSRLAKACLVSAKRDAKND